MTCGSRVQLRTGESQIGKGFILAAEGEVRDGEQCSARSRRTCNRRSCSYEIISRTWPFKVGCY